MVTLVNEIDDELGDHETDADNRFVYQPRVFGLKTRSAFILATGLNIITGLEFLRTIFFFKETSMVRAMHCIYVIVLSFTHGAIGIMAAKRKSPKLIVVCCVLSASLYVGEFI